MQLSGDSSMFDWTCCFLQGKHCHRLSSARWVWCGTCKFSIGSACRNAADVWQVGSSLRIELSVLLDENFSGVPFSLR